MILLEIDWEQVREDWNDVKEIGTILLFVGVAVFWMGENEAWDVLPRWIELIAIYLGYGIGIIMMAGLLYDRYTVPDSKKNAGGGDR